MARCLLSPSGRPLGMAVLLGCWAPESPLCPHLLRSRLAHTCVVALFVHQQGAVMDLGCSVAQTSLLGFKSQPHPRKLWLLGAASVLP